jgi:hypothetical protein
MTRKLPTKNREPDQAATAAASGYDVTKQKKNREKQARWRERHIEKRRRAQQIVNILVRKTLTDDHVGEVAALLNTFFNRHGVRVLRRRLRELSEATPQELAARNKENERQWRALWVSEGRSLADYKAGFDDNDSAVWEWRRAKGEAAVEAQRRAWERDHPIEEWPEHLCGLSDREYTDYQRWLRKYERGKAASP